MIKQLTTTHRATATRGRHGRRYRMPTMPDLQILPGELEEFTVH